jgi:2-iminobutanoate/2-iminopropanoate deaminase
MKTSNVSRRNFGTALASFFSGLGVASLFGRTASASASPAAAPAPQATASGVTKLSYDGKPTDGKSFITPLVIYNGVIYIAGQGAHSHDSSTFDMDITLHTTKVMDNVKNLVEAGGGTMDSILQLTVYLSTIDNYDGMNKVFAKYFPNGGPARTTVAVAALPGNSLVEINCTAAVVKK